MQEFEAIDRYWGQRLGLPASAQVPVGIGDDCAAIMPSPDHWLLTSTDTLVEGVHFLTNVAPDRLGHKALAVNLSDLAACGARPIGYLLALSLPRQVWSEAQADAWFIAFRQGMQDLAERSACPLIGGDTTASPAGSPLVITITVFGELPQGTMLTRRGARPGDSVWVSGHLGGAALALHQWTQQGVRDESLARLLEMPMPRLELGMALRVQGLASAAIDVSDGLAGDLGHVLQASSRAAGTGLVARLARDRLPVHPALGAAWTSPDKGIDHARTLNPDLPGKSLDASLSGVEWDAVWSWVLQGGDDYELCFTVPAAVPAWKLIELSATLGLPLAHIGELEAAAAPGIILDDGRGQHLPIPMKGYCHG